MGSGGQQHSVISTEGGGGGEVNDLIIPDQCLALRPKALVGLAFRIEAPERVVVLGVLLLAVGVLDHIREPVLESCSMPLSYCC